MISKIKNSAGFTLVELIVSIAIFLVLIIGAANLLVSVLQNPKAQLTAMDNIDRARFVSSSFLNEIRAAAYGSYPLLKAGSSEIIFNSPVGASAGNINRIRYYLSGDTLYKGVIAPPGTTESVTPVLTGISATTTTTVAVGGTLQMGAATNSDATNKTVTWSSGDPSIATINSSTGLLTAVSVGTVTVTATATDGSGTTGTEQITVTP